MFGQIGTSSGTLRFLHADGHGSTRLLSDAAAAVVAAFGYDAFGSPLGFDPAAAGTIYLFGGDGVYDAASGLTLHGNGVRARRSFLFLQRDPYAGDRQDPLSLHKYLYAHANPVTYSDPSGMCTFIDVMAGVAQVGRAMSDVGNVLGLAGSAMGVAGALGYYAATMSLAMMSMTGDFDPVAMGQWYEVQELSLAYMEAGGMMAAVGFGMSGVGSVMRAGGMIGARAGSYLSQVHAISSRRFWRFGRHHSMAKWRNQMAKRGWTPRQIDEAISRGLSFRTDNKVNRGNPATQYVHPETRRSVVVDDVTDEVLHVGGDGFRY